MKRLCVVVSLSSTSNSGYLFVPVFLQVFYMHFFFRLKALQYIIERRVCIFLLQNSLNRFAYASLLHAR